MFAKAIMITAVCAGSLLAQTAGNNSNATNAPDVAIKNPPEVGIKMAAIAGFGQIGVTGAIAGPMSTVAGAPYSAQTSTQRVQLLADGNRIEQTTTGSVARDAQGRVRREETLPGLGPDNGEAPHLIFIDDPVAGVHWNLDPQRKTAFKMPFLQIKAPALSTSMAVPAVPAGPDRTFFFTSGTVSTSGGVQIVSKSTGPQDANASKTDLGTQNIEGVAAQGTRVTRTIPAGSVGNDLPIAITTETWYSPDLKVLVMSKSNDPRMGDTTYTLTNIQRSEPPASLFQVPDDYTVKDQPANNFVFRDAKKNE